MDLAQLSAPELAHELGMSPKRLRTLIREHGLAPGHLRWARYRFDAADVERITRHPAVRAASSRGR